MNKKLLFLAGLAPLVAAPALVVASCSSSTTTDGTTGMTPEETAAATKAIENAKNYLESKSYFFADKKPSEVDLSKTDLPALKQSQNLGFSTKYFYDDKNVTNNDETGEKTIRIEVSRGKAKLSNQSAVLKLKSTKDDETDSKTKVDELLNLDPVVSQPISPLAGQTETKKTVRKATVFVKDYDQEATAPEASKISEFIKNFETKRLDLFLRQSSDEKVNIKGFDLGFKSLVKKDKNDLKVENFEFSNVRQTKVGSIEAPSITFDLRLQSDDKSKKSAPVEVNLVGFRLDEGYKDKVKDLFNQAITEFGGLYNPIIDESKTANVKASSVTKDNLTNYLLTDWKDMGGDLIVPIEIESSIVDVVSSNDSEGSLTVKFKFKRVGKGADITPIEDEKEIKLFGFQVVQTQ